MGTTRKKAAGFPRHLLQLKEQNKALTYGSLVSRVTDGILCFAWQDNNVVLGLTTAFSLGKEQDVVIRERRRPRVTSTNASVALPVFGKEWKKDLPIPIAIDAYNHGMNAVDIANQLRANFSCHLNYERRNWRPLA